MDKRQEDWLWKEDKVGTGKGQKHIKKVRTTGEENEPLSRFSCADDTAKVASTRHQAKVPATESQEDRCLNKSFDKTCTADLLKTKQADTCLSKKKKKRERNKEKSRGGRQRQDPFK